MGFVVMFWGVGSLAGAVLMARLASFERRGLLIGIGAVLFSMGFWCLLLGTKSGMWFWATRFWAWG